jgi:magnesium chelatase subunit D
LAVARVARVLAAWEGARRVATRHVDRAAELFGYRPADDTRPQPAAVSAPSSQPHAATTQSPDVLQVTDAAECDTTAPKEPVVSGPVRPVGESLSPVAGGTSVLYPEDLPAPPADLQTFRINRLAARSGARQFKGHAVGSLPARDTTDLALLATVLEAAKFRRIRRKHRRWKRRQFFIIPADLRRPRYLSDPGDALVLVLDHTCWRGWNRAVVLDPYLRHCAERDASATVIEFGFRGARSEYAAERYKVSSLQDPRILASLSRSPGRASPLAHALDLALSDLRRQVRRAVSPQQCTLLIATDGRGNIPLEASLRGRSPGEDVGRTGIMDAEQVAERIGALSGVEVVVIAPDLGSHRDLLFSLAEETGAGRVRFAPKIARGVGDERSDE